MVTYQLAKGAISSVHSGRIKVIHEGVDTKLFMPTNKLFDKSPNYHVTYTSRALEPMRCYNHFYKIIAPVMKAIL